MTVVEPLPVDIGDPAPTQDEVIEELRVAGLVLRDVDVAAASAAISNRFSRRLRIERIGAIGAAAVLIIALLVVTQLGAADPDSVIADGDDSVPTAPSTTQQSVVADEMLETAPPPAPTSVPLPAVTPVLPPAPVATAPALPTPVAPSSTAPATTSPPTIPNSPLSASLDVVTPVVATGEPASIEVSWSDEDHADSVDAQVSVDWGDDAVGALMVSPDRPACDQPGTAAAGGRVGRGFVYATPGVHPVTVTVSSCGGLGAFGETVTLSAAITVGDSREAVEPSVALVVSLPRADPAVEVPPLSDAAAEFTAAGADEVVRLDDRPSEPQFTAFGVASVLRVPLKAHGTVRLTWPDSPCSLTAQIDLRELTPGEVPTTVLSATC